VSKITDAIAWFKQQFGPIVTAKAAGTPFSLDLISAIAMQETYCVWGDLYKTVSTAELLRVCVGDTLDAPHRLEFPKNKAVLLAERDGDTMFTIARAALEDVARHNAACAEIAHMNPNKFCRGFGIVEYDLQHFRDDPDFFLNEDWHDFGKCLDRGLAGLNKALERTYGPAKSSLSHAETVYLAIAYSRGCANLSKDFKQGYKDVSGKYYGEHIDAYLTLAEATTAAA